MSLMASTIRSRKNKGCRLQNKVVELLRAYFPHWTDDDIKPAVMGEAGEDIHLSSTARKEFPFSIECKNQEKVNIWAAIEQAESNAKNNIPAVVFKRNRSDTYIIMNFGKFLEILHGHRK
jgi:hypothetical protein